MELNGIHDSPRMPADCQACFYSVAGIDQHFIHCVHGISSRVICLDALTLCEDFKPLAEGSAAPERSEAAGAASAGSKRLYVPVTRKVSLKTVQNEAPK